MFRVRWPSSWLDYLNTEEAVVIEEQSKKQLAITIYAEVTPNPAVMKFVANRKIVSEMHEFKNIDEAASSNLAKELFHLPYVKEVFMDENYVSVTKYELGDWGEITMELRELIRDFIANGKEVINLTITAQKAEQTKKSQLNPSELDETSKEIINILEEYVKPAVASDGGNILFQSYDTESKTVNVILQGACSGCPSSTFTLKNGIENMLKNMLGDKVQEVVALNG